MRILFLTAFLLWPFTHVEHGVVHLAKDGTASVGYEKIFKKDPDKIACTFQSKNPVKRQFGSRESMVLMGTPHDRVAWKCK